MQAILKEWSLPLGLTLTTLLTGAIYANGWFAIRKTRKTQFTWQRLAYFLLGIATLWLAIASPFDGFADTALSAHMLQHLLLISVIPPLLLLGWPTVPLLRGLPRFVTRSLLDAPMLRRFGRFLISPIPAWLGMNGAFLLWHVPRAFDYALKHEHWHQFEHVCFFFTSIAFWFPIIRPWPTSANRQNWNILAYLISADLINTAVAAFLVFCDFPVYAFYLNQTNPFTLSATADQQLGGLVMWVGGSVSFLLPAALIALRLVQSGSRFLSRPDTSLVSADANASKGR